MKLSTRLWLTGALVPSLVLLVVLELAAQAFRIALQSSLDQALLAQAAVESVSLFDRADPHLHMAESPLLAEVRPFAPTGSLFDDHGTLLAHFPPLPHPVAEAPAMQGPASELSTRQTETGRQRELVVRVTHSDGRTYALRLSASLAQIDDSVFTFHVTVALVVLFTALVLAAIQAVLGRRLSLRLSSLSSHLDRVRGGDLASPPPPDAQGDEVSALRDVLAEATVQLARARTVQERLVADAAHELRTPLTLMRTTLDLALRRQRSADELKQALTDAREEVDRLAHLATGLLEVASAGHGWELVEGDLAQVLQDAADGSRAEAEARGVHLWVDAKAPATARFDARAMRQAVDNLLSNALRFAPRGTAIDLSLRPEAGGWCIAVRDRGVGIPEAEREAVFAPFHRTDRRGGSGLGLAIVSEVMRHHRGSARAVTPREGPGVEIELRLPPAP